MKLSEKTQKVLDRILAGEVPTQHVVTGSLVRGIPKDIRKDPVVFPNGDKIHNSIIHSLTDKGLIVKKLTFATWGYIDKDYAFYPASKVPDKEPEKVYAL